MQTAKKSVDMPRKNSEPQWMRKQIGSNIFYVAVHFSQTSKDTLDDKIFRLVEREAASQ
jgi:hypothetical protein